MGDMPVDNATRFAMGLPTMAESEAQANREFTGDAHVQDRLAQIEAAEEERKARERLEMERGGTQRDVASISGAAQRDVARINAAARMRSGYNQGGAVYKHAHPTYIKFGQTGDSSLLAKGRR